MEKEWICPACKLPFAFGEEANKHIAWHIEQEPDNDDWKECL